MNGTEKRRPRHDIAEWNAQHPPGTAVAVVKDDGSVWLTVTRSEAWETGGGDPIVKLRGNHGGYLLTRVTAIRRETLMALLAPEQAASAMRPEDVPRRIPSQDAERAVPHDEAKQIAQRLISGSYRRDGERLPTASTPRFSIPCRPNHDDDMLIMAYIEQCRAHGGALAEDWQAAREWYQKNEQTIRAAGVGPAPDFMVPF